MQKENYAELTRANKKISLRKEKFIQNVYIDLIIREAILKEKKRRIKEKIDEAIDQKDRERFFLLSEELAEIENELNA